MYSLRKFFKAVQYSFSKKINYWYPWQRPDGSLFQWSSVSEDTHEPTLVSVYIIFQESHSLGKWLIWNSTIRPNQRMHHFKRYYCTTKAKSVSFVNRKLIKFPLHLFNPVFSQKHLPQCSQTKGHVKRESDLCLWFLLSKKAFTDHRLGVISVRMTVFF